MDNLSIFLDLLLRNQQVGGSIPLVGSIKSKTYSTFNPPVFYPGALPMPYGAGDP